MGSSGGGKGKVLNASFTPLQAIFGQDSSIGKIEQTLNAPGEIGKQSFINTNNYVSGKEAFGDHKNWFGNGWAGDTLNPMMGAETEIQRKASEQREQINQDKWQVWSEKNGKPNPYPKQSQSSTSSFLFGDEDDDDSLL